MLTIAPECCLRMIGSTCLQAMIVPRRLIADTRSNTASVSSSSGLSPPAMLTPTLLCRMSMRPQRSTAAHRGGERRLARDVGLEGDAFATPLAASTAVSSAETRSRSTARIFAPSCAKRSTVARALPIPAPGLCPAPTTTAIFPARRIMRVLSGPTEQQDYKGSRRYYGTTNNRIGVP